MLNLNLCFGNLKGRNMEQKELLEKLNLQEKLKIKEAEIQLKAKASAK